MTIVNIDSPFVIKQCHKELLEQILLCGDKHCHGALMDRDSYWQISQRVPVFLLSDKSMEKYRKIYPTIEEWEFDKKRDTNPPTEYLGFYTRSSGTPFENTPIVVVSPERIAKLVSNEEEYLFLLIKVILHEFAHARMDFGGENDKYGKINDLLRELNDLMFSENENGKIDKFFRWMEESLANYQVLEVLKDWQIFDHFLRRTGHRYAFDYRDDFFKKLFEFVKNFIKRQPPEYALGEKLYEKGVWSGYWRLWRDYKEELGKSHHKEKSVWLQYVMKQKDIDRDKIDKLYDALFKKE